MTLRNHSQPVWPWPFFWWSKNSDQQDIVLENTTISSALTWESFSATDWSFSLNVVFHSRHLSQHPRLTFQTLLWQSCFSLWPLSWYLEDITIYSKAVATISWVGQAAPLGENVVFKVWIGAEAAPSACDITTSLQVSIWKYLRKNRYIRRITFF